MTALYAVLRPAWRPLTLLHLGIVWLVVAFLLQVIPDVSEVMPVLRALWLGAATPAMVTALWVVLAIAPAGIGLVVATSRIDLQHTTLSWHLPGVRRRFVTGTVVCGFTVAIALTALMSRTAAAGATVAAFSLAFYSFLVPGFCFDVAVPRPARLLMALPLIAVVARPGWTAQLGQEHPVLWTAMGLVLVGLQLPAITSARMARVRPFRWSRLRRSGSRAPYWENRKVGRRAWRQSLATRRLLPWLRAAGYESEARYPLAHLGLAALTVLAARPIDIPTVVPVFAGAFLMKSGLQLRMRIAYPLSRGRRAGLAYAGTVVEAATYFLFLGALLYATSLVPLPRLPSVDWESSRAIHWVLVWGCSLALVPIVQWRRIRWPAEEVDRLSGTRLLGFLLRLLAYMFFVGLAAERITAFTGVAGDIGRSLVAVGMLVVLAQATHAILVYVHFTRRDIVL